MLAFMSRLALIVVKVLFFTRRNGHEQRFARSARAAPWMAGGRARDWPYQAGAGDVSPSGRAAGGASQRRRRPGRPARTADDVSAGRERAAAGAGASPAAPARFGSREGVPAERSRGHSRSPYWLDHSP